MAQDEQPPGGLLSKVVKFVRNPTVNWSDLDQPEDKESHYSKQMLKEMIERKRANDFVRRREFDQLRKLRQRNALGVAGDPDAAGRVSFFQSSLPSNPGDRAGTLKKIDEIEAQMSRQWWKGKDQGLPPPEPTAEAMAALDAAQHARQYATTIHAVLPDTPIRDTDFAATDISPMSHLRDGVSDSGDLLAVDEGLTLDWPTGPVQQPGAQEFVYDPALEEAAIRFANGDDAGAESALQSLLGGGAHMPAQDGIWLALFDLYRATEQRARFDALAADFVAQAGRPAPRWSVGIDAAGLRDEAASARGVHWSSPGVLDVAEVLRLQSLAGGRTTGPRTLDWSQLTAIDDAALAPLAALFTDWSLQPLALRMVAGGRLDGLLRSCTVSGERVTSAHWWRLRMEWLRLMRRPDEFDLVALDYCITYEVSPPAWQDSACNAIALDALASAIDSGMSTIPDGVLAAAPATGALSGAITGDATDLLASIDVSAPGDVVIDCASLVRIDFAATGSVLNWTVARQSAGRQVQFTGLHRLVAAFFNLIGVGEHATILSRRS